MTCFDDLAHPQQFPHVSEIASYPYDAANQLYKVNRLDGSYTTFSYDNNGNMVGENRYDNQGLLVENRSYTYDFNDRLVRVEISGEDNSTRVVEYGYDPLGDRVAKSSYAEFY